MACLLMIIGIVLIKTGRPEKDGTPSGVAWLQGLGSLVLLVSCVWWVGFGLNWWDVP